MLISKSQQLSKITKFEWVLLLLVWSMFWGFMFSRAVVSIAIIGLFIISLHPKKINYHWQVFKANRFGWLSLLFFLVYFLSGLWSKDMNEWAEEIRVKLPFLVFPFAFIVLPFAKISFQKIFIQGLLALFTVGILFSLYFLINNFESFVAGRHFYGPLKGDYLRFSIGLILSINLAIYVLFEAGKFKINRLFRNLLIFYIILGGAYIHLQSSKLGLLALYALFAYYLIFSVHKKIGKKMTVLLFSGIFTFSIISAVIFPSFKGQINKVKTELAIWEKQNTDQYKEVSSIIPRIISYQAGFQLIRENPLLGVGAGDLKSEMDRVYEEQFPYMNHVLIPHNQYIASMATIGIPMSLLLIAMILYPLSREGIRYEKAVVVVMICATMIEAMLEIQHGVFIYLFFTLFWIAVRRRKAID